MNSCLKPVPGNLVVDSRVASASHPSACTPAPSAHPFGRFHGHMGPLVWPDLRRPHQLRPPARQGPVHGQTRHLELVAPLTLPQAPPHQRRGQVVGPCHGLVQPPQPLGGEAAGPSLGLHQPSLAGGRADPLADVRARVAGPHGALEELLAQGHGGQARHRLPDEQLRPEGDRTVHRAPVLVAGHAQLPLDVVEVPDPDQSDLLVAQPEPHEQDHRDLESWLELGQQLQHFARTGGAPLGPLPISTSRSGARPCVRLRRHPQRLSPSLDCLPEDAQIVRDERVRLSAAERRDVVPPGLRQPFLIQFLQRQVPQHLRHMSGGLALLLCRGVQAVLR